jgi:hypothetical protein
LLDVGNEDGPYWAEDCLRLDGTYTEHRELDLAQTRWHDVGSLRVGEDYILRSLGARWSWWTEDTVENVTEYTGERGSMGLGQCGGIVVKVGNEWKFRVIE